MRKKLPVQPTSQAGYLYLIEGKCVSDLIEMICHGGGLQPLLDDELISGRALQDLSALRCYDHSLRTIRMNVIRLALSLSDPDKYGHYRVECDWPLKVQARVVSMLREGVSRKYVGVRFQIDRDLLSRLNNETTTVITLSIGQYLRTGKWSQS